MTLTDIEIKRELWERGDIDYLLRPEQLRLLTLLKSAPTDLAVFNISRRFGKTTTCTVFSVSEAIKRKQRILFATAFLTDLVNYVRPIFEQVLADCPDNNRPTFNETRKVYEFPNGSTIRLVGLDKNANALRGNAIDILIVDEAAFVQKLQYLFESVIVPATMSRPFKLIFPSTPPVSPEHFWSKVLIDKARARGTYVELTIDSISSLAEAEKERLLNEVGGKDSVTAQREFYCKILIDITRAIAPSFNHTKQTWFYDSHPGHIRWQFIGDSGGIRDKTVILKAGFDHDRQAVIVDSELVFDNKTPTSTIAERFKEWSGTDELTLDAHGQTLVDLASFGIKAALPPKDEFGASIAFLNSELHLGRVLIHPRCKLLLATLSGGLLTASRNDLERTESLGHCDAVAALIYALRAVDRVSDLRPRPRRETVWQPPPPKNPILKAFGA
jgi:hypothetical protein